MKKAYVFAALVFVLLFGSVATAYASIPHYSVAYSKRQIVKAAKAAHASTQDIKDLNWLAHRESTFRNWAHNTRYECHGLFQLSKGMAHGHPWWVPYWNTTRAIKYMRGRYGSIHKARLFWERHHWY